jgi:hypothetical protein
MSVEGEDGHSEASKLGIMKKTQRTPLWVHLEILVRGHIDGLGGVLI